MNFFEKTVNFFSSSRQIASPIPGFDAAGYGKPSLFNWAPPQKSANTEISQGQQRTLIARAYDANRNQDIARAIVEQLKTNVVNVGLKLNPNIDGEMLGLTQSQEDELENAILSEFSLWCEECDIERTLDFDEMQILVLVNWFISGNSILNTVNVDYPRNLYSLKIQAIDYERLTNPSFGQDTKNMLRGVEVNQYGAPVAYHILDAHPADLHIDPVGARHWSRIPAYDELDRKRVLHIFEKERPGHTVGFSGFAPILERLKQLDRIDDSEVMATLVSSWLTLFIESDKPEENLGFKKKKDDPRMKKDADGNGKDTFELGPGAVVELTGGKKINPVNPMRPNTNLVPFRTNMAQSLCASLGLPLEEVFLIFNSSFSASRAAMLKGGKAYNMKRVKLAKRTLSPVYSLWFDEAVLRGRLPHVPETYWTDERVRKSFQAHQWLASGHGAIDERAEASASAERMKNNISSLPDEVAKLTGQNYKTVFRQQAKAMRLLASLGLPWPFDVKENSINEEKDKETINEPNPGPGPSVD